jgi:hypothetical protein
MLMAIPLSRCQHDTEWRSPANPMPCVVAYPESVAHGPLMPDRSPLDDPRNALHAWNRFRKLMRLMMAITAVVVLIAMVLIYLDNGLESIHLYIATALGVGFAMLLTGALMGLVFLSSGTGHDQSVTDARARDADDQAGGDGRSR